MGSAHIPITTSSELAQTYFDQGLRLHYGFWISESRRSFEEAIRQDPDAPMPYWGKAWAFGAYHNNGAPAVRDLETSYAAIHDAMARKSKATALEQGLIDAMAKRVNQDTKTPRAQLDVAYAAAMRSLAEQYPDNVNVLVLAAAAEMNTNRWNYWDDDGKANDGDTEWFVATLEKALELEPRHSGAIHYYLHGVEASDDVFRARNPARGACLHGAEPRTPRPHGLAYSDPDRRLRSRGRHQHRCLDGRRALYRPAGIRKADTPSARTSTTCISCGSPRPWKAEAWWRSSRRKSSATRCSAPSRIRSSNQSHRFQNYMASTYYTLTRFGYWNDILSQPAPPAELKYLTAMWHYARGIALAHQGEIAKAWKEHGALIDITNGDILGGPSLSAMGREERPYSPYQQDTKNMVMLAGNAMAGEIAATEKKWEDAITYLEKAVIFRTTWPIRSRRRGITRCGTLWARCFSMQIALSRRKTCTETI